MSSKFFSKGLQDWKVPKFKQSKPRQYFGLLKSYTCC